VRTDDTRDQAVEHLLRRSLEIGSQAGVSADCLDAETFAAWTDGALRGAALAAVEAHVAGCARCQSVAAVMVRTVPATPVAIPWWRRSLRSAWLVPITAGAAAVAIWSVVPNRPPLPAQPTASVAPAEQTLPESKAQSEPAFADRVERRADAAAKDRGAPAAPVAAPAAAPPRSAEESARMRETAGALMKQEAFAREVVSPDPAIRWRFGPAGTIDRTEDGGATWTRLTTGVTSELIAGASPSSPVCWVVGRNGTVLRSIDGRTWERVNIPETADLVTVEAVDASTAVVTASDGRRFRTSDGGRTWVK
jgi:Photosynthesis system II assembly factor YCF48/Putative zinc-finger